MRVDGYAPIRDYAAIGDGRTVALVARDGAIDWLCLPDMDSASVFARILDAERGGSFQLQPDEPFDGERRYREGSNVLETTFRTASGVVRVTDAMTLAAHDLAPFREIVRSVEGLSGTVRMRWRFDPRFEYGGRRGKLERRGNRWVAVAGREAIALGVWDVDAGARDDGGVSGAFDIREGDRALLDLSCAHQGPLILACRGDAERRLEHTDRFWREWSGRAKYDGPWRGAVVRSALALKLCVFAQSGAIVAAPTTSLPEWVGAGRNWDYRFTWVRDASYTLDALLRLGYHDEANAFFWWLMHASRLTQPRLQILYRLNGSARARERILPTLGGYRGSAPVRIGNGAADQIQLDVYGAFLDCIWRYAEEWGIDRDTAKEVAEIADFVARVWREPDSGIWEVRSDPTHFVQSKAMCWVALDRACRLAREGHIPNRSRSWQREADAIHEFVESEGFDPERGVYKRATTMPELDASVLTLLLFEYASDGDRLERTTEAVRRELADGPLVDRYRGEDGVEGDEGAFLTCSFWLVDALARCGRVEDAEALMAELAALANDVGLYAEEVDRETRDFLGNFPQALVHLALVNAAVSIEDARA